MSTSPPPLISEQRAKVALLATTYERERAVLDGMEQLFASLQSLPQQRRGVALSGVSVSAIFPRPPAQRPNAGRQPGSISKRWRLVLSQVVDRSFHAASIVRAVEELEGRSMRHHDARRQMEKYVELGFVRAVGDGIFKITETAIEKFNLRNPEAIASEAEDAPDELQNENVPPSGFDELLGGTDTAQDAQ